VAAGAGPAARRGYWASVLQRLVRNPVAMGAGLLLLLMLMAIFGPPWRRPTLCRLDAQAPQAHRHRRLPAGQRRAGPRPAVAPDVGARLSLFMGITPVLLAFVIGTAIGILAGYAGGAPTP
jgi:peptide/nickel transport system permease protein